MRFSYFIIALFICFHSFGQDIPSGYKEFIKKADAFLEKEKFKDAAFAYADAFKTLGNKGFPEDRYKAACAWAQAGYPDSAIMNLERIAYKSSYSEFTKTGQEKYFAPLRSHKKWNTVLDKIKFNQDSINALEAKKDKKLMALLDSMTQVDQKYRKLWGRYNNGKIPKDSISESSITSQWRKVDSSNFLIVRRIFYTHGFPDYDLVGREGSSNFWLLVQHADRHPAFQDSVLIEMKKVVDKQKTSGVNYAYLIDRVKVNAGQMQIYGTQMQVNKEGTSFEPKPVVEPEKLNDRRKSVGLGTIEEYIQTMNQRNYGSLNKK